MITIEAITSDFQVEVTNPNSWRLSFASCHDYPGDYASEGGEAGMGKPFNWDLIAQRHPEAFIWYIHISLCHLYMYKERVYLFVQIYI